MRVAIIIALLVGCSGSSGGGPDCDPTACAAAGGACTSDEACEFVGAGGANLIRCPAGLRCEVDCADPGTCAGGVDCGSAYTCIVLCRGPDSCANEVTCGVGPCLVTCSGDGSCDNGVTCRDSCSCDVRCSGVGACADAPVCPATCSNTNGCTSEPGGCDICDS